MPITDEIAIVQLVGTLGVCCHCGFRRAAFDDDLVLLETAYAKGKASLGAAFSVSLDAKLWSSRRSYAAKLPLYNKIGRHDARSRTTRKTSLRHQAENSGDKGCSVM